MRKYFSKKGAVKPSPFIFLLTYFLIVCVGCQKSKCDIEPLICYSSPPCLIESLPSCFPALTYEEKAQDWGKELYMGKAFAKESDHYRALTCFKRALLLVPLMNERRLEIEYEIFFTYYIANKYQEAIEAFERSRLIEAPESFPIFHDLLIALYDSYIQIDSPERAYRILALIESFDRETAENLKIETAIMDANFPALSAATYDSVAAQEVKGAINEFLITYDSNAKSVSKAKLFNALLPGAGYYYVGQTKSAITSFIINALFIGAAYQLFDRGYVPAAIIVTSLEAGWYFGGINGAGLEAKQFNENLYSRTGREMMIQQRLFPILMIQKGF